MYFVNREPSEPVYQGKKLSEWLELKTSSAAPLDFEAYERSADAVRDIGTNAVPCLLKWIAYEPIPRKQKAVRLAAKLPGRLDDLARTMLYRGRDRRCTQAILGFQMLGAAARDAEPELARLMTDTTAPVTADRARICLTCIRASDQPRRAFNW